MAEARSQQAASLTELSWLGHRFPITNAKTRVAILKGSYWFSSWIIIYVNISNLQAPSRCEMAVT